MYSYGEDFDLCQVEVQWWGESGMSLARAKDKLPEITESLSPPRPSVIYLDVAGNDLDRRGDNSPSYIAQEVLCLATSMLEQGVSLVIISAVLPRSQPKYTKDSQVFNARATEFNSFMKDTLVQHEATRHVAGRYKRPGIWWWVHQKLTDSPPLCADGIHLSDLPGNKHLYRSIRLALFEAEKWLNPIEGE